MNRITERFTHLAAQAQKGLVVYITAGDPDLTTTADLIVEMAAQGADIIELGVPFSDPMADGPVIQRATQRALAQGVKLSDIFDLVAKVRRQTDVPIVLFSYFNPLLQYGLDKVATTAKAVGIDGVLVTDLVPEEAADFLTSLQQQDLAMIFLVAPTSSAARLAKVAAVASGFVYAVSRTGVTGMQASLPAAVQTLVTNLRQYTSLPIAVGFGISNAAQVQEIWQSADAAVVGSRIVAEIEAQQALPRAELIAAIGQLTRSLKEIV
jgi:tryptophan synthase alpha chain